MKKIFLLSSILTFTLWSGAFAQDKRDLQYFRTPGYKGLNVFETSKKNLVPYHGVKVRLGGDFALQFQGINHSSTGPDTLATLGNNFNLPTANLNIGVQLYDGVRMNMIMYLSSRHHQDTWVKGGYMQIDKLDFIKKGFLEGLMNIMTIKVGMDEINYGDVHFRRTDNARAIYNPFVGNYIMDAFTTEAFGELMFQKSNFLLVAGLSNGNLNQTTIKDSMMLKPSLYGKIGYDRQFSDDLRGRLTGSFYLSPGYDNGQYLYNGDRTGARYYHVMQAYNATDNFRSGRFSPGFMKYFSYQINPFIKWKGLEFFGVYEVVSGDISKTKTGGSYTQLGAELIYRIGKKQNFYVGGRYNTVNGHSVANATETSIDRLNLGGGWFLTNNILLKAEYVNQNYTGKGWAGSIYQGGNFNGGVAEAVISF